MTEVPHESDSSNPMDLSLTVKVPAVEKLVEYTLSGIVGPITAPWREKREAKALAIQTQSQADAIRIMAEAQSYARSLLESPTTSLQGELDIQQRISQRLYFQEVKKEASIKDVYHLAEEHLGDKTVPDQEPNHDFTSRFFDDVQHVSSAEAKVLYSKVLAGEIQRPGSFSLLSLNILKNMDANTAQLFRTLCSACIAFVPDGKNIMDIRVPVLKGNAAQNALRQYGLSFDLLNLLNEHSLVLSDYNSWFDYHLCIGRMVFKTQVIQIPFSFQGRFWVLVPQTDRQLGAEFRVSGVSLTQVGRELSTIVDVEPMPEFTRELKTAFASQHKLQMVQTANGSPKEATFHPQQ